MSKFVKKDQVFLNNPATTRDEVLKFVSEQAVDLGIADDADCVLSAILEREAEGATGLKDGFAIPHAQADCIRDNAVVVVKTAQPIEWETMDKKPVTCAIALLCPEGEAGKGHLRLLSQLTTLLMRPKFCETVMSATDAEHIASAINEGLDGK